MTNLEELKREFLDWWAIQSKIEEGVTDGDCARWWLAKLTALRSQDKQSLLEEIERIKTKVVIGNKIKIDEGYNESTSTHSITLVVWNAWNDRVPAEIHTCCGIYQPTSAADGYWKGKMRLGGWEIIPSPIIDEVLSLITKLNA